MRTQLLALILVMVSATCAFAVADGGGDGGCCGLPAELAGRGQLMEESFRAADTDELRRQRWAGELCLNHPCEDEITEDQAKDLLDGLTASMQRASDQRLSWIGFVVGALSLICSIFALWQTHENSRVARDASERSIRNETKIDMMRDG